MVITQGDSQPLVILDDDSDEDSIAIWDAGNGRKVTVPKGRFDEEEWFSFSPSGTTLLTKSLRSFSVRLLNAESGELLHTFTAHTDLVYRNIVN